MSNADIPESSEHSNALRRESQPASVTPMAPPVGEATAAASLTSDLAIGEAEDATISDVTPPGSRSSSAASNDALGKVVQRKHRRWLVAVGLVLVVTGGLWWKLGIPGVHRVAGAHDDPHAGSNTNSTSAIPVNTIRPVKKTLERTLLQPGSIQPAAQAELYAETSGPLKTIRHQTTPQVVADEIVHRICGLRNCWPGAATGVLPAVVSAHLIWSQAPQIDIGSYVRRGELLMVVDVPERTQDVIGRETVLAQRHAEYDQAWGSLKTFEAAVESAKAQKGQAEAEVRRYESDHAFRSKELKRIQQLVRDRTTTQEIEDEKQLQVAAALSAWDSSRAKVRVAEAELALVTSKLEAAKAELKVKAVLIEVARDELHRARILANYVNIYAPFDGLITYRDVDEGDFVQNATSGQARKLMTVTAIDNVKVVLKAREQDALLVQVGAPAMMYVHGRSGIMHGRVARVDNVLDRETRTMQVEIDLDNHGRTLLPGMYGDVTVVLQKIPNAQAIPATAVYSRKGENYIMQIQDGVAKRHRVRIRYDDGKEVEVVKLGEGREDPLNGNEEIIVSNKGEIGEGQRVKSTPLPH